MRITPRRIVALLATPLALSFAAAIPSTVSAADDRPAPRASEERRQDVRDAKEAKRDAERETGFDSTFVKDAAQRLLGEIELSRMVEQRSNSDGVKHYAALQIKEYRDILDTMRRVGAAEDIKTPDEISDRQRDSAKRLKEVSSTEFDLQYMSGQLDEQQSLINLFTRAARDCDNHELKAFAAKTVPDLQARYDNARSLYRKIKQKDTD
jgi:putative membrane protein